MGKVTEIRKANGEVMRIIDGEYVIGANSGCFANPSPCRKIINGEYLVEGCEGGERYKPQFISCIFKEEFDTSVHYEESCFYVKDEKIEDITMIKEPFYWATNTNRIDKIIKDGKVLLETKPDYMCSYSPDRQQTYKLPPEIIDKYGMPTKDYVYAYYIVQKNILIIKPKRYIDICYFNKGLKC